MVSIIAVTRPACAGPVSGVFGSDERAAQGCLAQASLTAGSRAAKPAARMVRRPVAAMIRPASTWSASTELTAMAPVGNYAYSIHFSDRHATGIYPLELLRALGRRVQP